MGQGTLGRGINGSVVSNQLNEHQQLQIQAFIHSRTLNVTYFSADEIEIILTTDYPKALEFQDKTVFFLAKSLNCNVLTGDAPLRKFCASQNITVRGIIWIFDRFIQEELISYNLAILKMEHLMSFNTNTRLPKDDCIERLANWEKSIS
jgi:rRNA-processing protein FCF1